MFHSSPGPSFPSQHPEPSFWPVASQRGLPLHHSPVHVLHKYHWGIPLFQTLRLWWGAGRALWPGVQLEGEVWWGWGYIINADFSLKLYPLSLPIGIENSEKKTKKKKKFPAETVNGKLTIQFQWHLDLPEKGARTPQTTAGSLQGVQPGKDGGYGKSALQTLKWHLSVGCCFNEIKYMS